jgi:hypothetical protein
MHLFTSLLAASLVLVAGCSSADLVVAAPDDDATPSDGAVVTETAGDETAGDAGEDARETSPTADTADSAIVDGAPDGAPEASIDATIDDSLAHLDTGSDGGDASPADAPDARDAGDAADGDAFATDVPVPDVAGDAIADAAKCDAPVRCYLDRDDDDYVAATGAFDACTCPVGSKTISATGTLFDCHDDDPAVHPGAGFRDLPYCVPGTACTVKSFDYDCNGTQDKELGSAFGGCSTFGSGCVGAGWQGGTVPECGATQGFTTCSKATLSCAQSSAWRLQRCR